MCNALNHSAKFVAIAVIGLLLSEGCETSAPVLRGEHRRPPEVVPGKKSVLFVSDTQSPIFLERLFIASDDNVSATERIFDAIARETTSAALFHLGDLTSMGGIRSSWNVFDRFSQRLGDAGMPVYPVFGNHEYMPSARQGISNMIGRFPFLDTSWYMRRIGTLAVLLLNSNMSRLSADEAREQERWYYRTLEELDGDSSVSVVIVACHHPPYTNSTVVDPSAEVQRRFVPAYLQSHKARLFMAGHAHALEHVQIEGKDFLVIGGGGGLLHRLRQGKDSRWHDLVVHPLARSNFHYVRVTPRGAGLEVEILTPGPDAGPVGIGYSFRVRGEE